MNQNNHKVSLVSLFFLALSCSFSANAGEKTTFQTANVKDFPAMSSNLPGAATLLRTQHTASATLALSGLDANSAYSIWWSIFNSPENCANGAGKCGAADLNNPATKASVFYASGFVTGNDGVANVTARIKAGALPIGYQALIPGGLQRGNGFSAEIQLVIRTHGEIITDLLPSQIGSYFGACRINYCAETEIVSFPPLTTPVN